MRYLKLFENFENGERLVFEAIDTWNDDALPRLFKNIEKALY
jgi:hypothetical protein